MNLVETATTLIVGNDRLVVEIDKASFSLLALLPRTGDFKVRFAPAVADASLWTALFCDDAGNQATLKSNASAARRFAVKDDALELVWEGMALGKTENAVDARVRVRLDGRLSSWQIALDVRPKQWGLWEVAFPDFGGLRMEGRDPADDALLISEGWGRRIRDPANRERLFVWDLPMYPSAAKAMQFFGFENGTDGLYVATHDPAARPKAFKFNQIEPTRPRLPGAPASPKRLAAQVVHYPEGMSRWIERFDLPYPVVLGVYSGGWGAAADIYRDWALQQSWASSGAVDKRPDVPPWLRDAQVWAQLSSTEAGVGGVAKLAADFAAKLGQPLAVHWYNWHKIPFDTDYPDYLPPKDGFAEAVAQLHEANVRVVPYINGRIVDGNSRAWREEDAGRYAARGTSQRLGSTFRELYVERYGSGQALMVMCPATDYWQKKVAGIVEELVHRYHVDGVYIDQIAAAPPCLCFETNHGHPAGGGEHWVAGYHALLAETRKRAGDAALVTECNAEPYIDYVPGYLMWHSAHEDSVPLFARVYGGRVLTFGRSFDDGDLEDVNRFVAKLAQMWVWGAQLGWFGNSVVEKLLKPEHTVALTFLRELAEAGLKAGKFLRFGTMLDPPPQLVPVPEVQVVWEVFGRSEMRLPGILHTAWKARDGAVGLVAVNVTDSVLRACWDASSCAGTRWRDVLTGGRWRKIKDARIEALIPGRAAWVAEVG